MSAPAGLTAPAPAPADTETPVSYRYRIVGPNSVGRWQDEGTTIEAVQDLINEFERHTPQGRHYIERQALGQIEPVPATSAEQSAEHAHNAEPRAPRP